MTDAAILNLRREFVCESLDLAFAHARWAARHLQEGRDKEAVAAFDRFIAAARSAAEEMKPIRAALADTLTAEAAVEYRQSRDLAQRRKVAA